MVEWYQPDFAVRPFDDAVDRLTRAAAAAHIRLLMTLTSPADETLFGVLAADSAEAVIQVCRQAGWQPDRITAGVEARITAAEH